MERITLYPSIVFLLIGIVHVYWAFGGTRGLQAAIPGNGTNKKLFAHSLLACLPVAFGLFAFAFISLEHSQIIPQYLKDETRFWLLAVICGIFALRTIGDFRYVGLFKKHKDSVFAKMDTKMYTPLSFSLFATLAIALNL